MALRESLKGEHVQPLVPGGSGAGGGSREIQIDVYAGEKNVDIDIM